MKTKIRTTYEQRKLLAHIKKLFAEKGYLAFTLAGPFRGHRDDFTAVPRGNPYGLFLVRFGTENDVVITPYGIVASSSGMRDVIAKSRISRGAQWRFTSQLLKARQKLPWQNVLSHYGRKEFKRLVPEYKGK